MNRSIVVALASATLLLGCRERTREAAEVVTELDRQVQELRGINLQLREENARLRAAAGVPQWDPVAQLERAGAPAGTHPFVRLCPNGRHAIGLRGRAGALVDELVVVCAASPGENGAFGLELDPVGRFAAGGTPFERLCAEGHVLIGLDGTAGDLLDSITPICGARAGSGEAAADAEGSGASADGSGAEEAPSRARRRARRIGTDELARIGGHGGHPFVRRCPAGSGMVGLSGRYGDVVEAVVVHCAPLPESPVR